MLQKEEYEDLLKSIALEFPDFKLVKKTDSKLMILIDVLLKVLTFGKMKKFMNQFITTLGNTVYVPDDWDDSSSSSKAITLRHERVHMRQSKKMGRFAFSIAYLFLPVPVLFAAYRRKFEMEAYEESLRAYNEYYGKKFFTPALKEHVVKHFTSAEYFWMWPWKESIEQWYDNVVEEITKESSS